MDKTKVCRIAGSVFIGMGVYVATGSIVADLFIAIGVLVIAQSVKKN